MFEYGFFGKGYNKEGFNKFGYNRDGYDKYGFDIDGYNCDGYDKEGFNKSGCDGEGYDRNGFDVDGYDRNGYDKDSFDRKGYNKEGYDRDGYDKYGFNIDGYNCDGYDKEGFNKSGCDREGYDRNGFNVDGYDRNGYDKDSFDRKGYNKEGYDRDGYDENGYDFTGCDKNGRMQENDKILYNINKQMLKIIDVSKDAITLELNRIITVSSNYGQNKEQYVKVETIVASVFDIGIKYFYSYKDYTDHKSGLIRDTRYLFNRENIENFFRNQYESIIQEIKKDEPKGTLMSEKDKDDIVLEYCHIKKEEVNESILFSQYSNTNYIGRIDLDTHFFRKNFENYLNKHYYQKVYITKENYKYIGNEIHFVNWRSPIANMYYDPKVTTLTRSSDVDIVNETINGIDVFDHGNIYEHELMLKRKYTSLKPVRFQNIYICNDDILYSEGSVDPFLLQILSENRQTHKLSDIIKTIQSNQNSIIRAGKEKNIIVQGCAGSGKTMILLHRLSYLKFNKLLPDKNNTKIITPSDTFSEFINDLSNTLELADIERITMFDYLVNICKNYQKKYSTEKKMYIEKKFREREVKENKKALEYYAENRIFESDTGYLDKDLTDLDGIIQALYKEKISAFMQEIDLNRIKHIAERFKIFLPDKNSFSDKAFLDRVFDIFDTIKSKNDEICREISDLDERINNPRCVKDEKLQLKEKSNKLKNICLRDEERTFLNGDFVKLSGRGRFVIDIYLELRTNYFKKDTNKEDYFISNKNEACALAYLYVLHCSTVSNADRAIFIDEGQDYSYFEYKVIRLVNGEECILNVFGDINQRVEFLNTIQDWQGLQNLLSAEIYTLNENYRNTAEITEYVNQKLNYVYLPIGVHGMEVKYIDKTELENDLNKFLNSNNGLRVAFVSLDKNYLNSVKRKLQKKELFVGNVIDVKGLEFDVVFVDDQDMNENERYISYTRALENLIIIK